MKKFWVLLAYGLRDQVRSRWVLAYGLFYFVAGVLLLQFGTDYRRYLASMANVILLLSPAVSILYSTVHWYANGSFRHLILVQPVSRPVVFFSSWLSILVGLSGAFVIGALGGPVLLGSFDARIFSILIAGLALTTVFSLLGILWAVTIRDRMKGLAGALGTWLYLAILHDGLILGILMMLRDFPMERPAMALLALNLIDIARLFLLLQFDLTALMGYTGSVLQRMARPGVGAAVIVLGSLFWILIPAIIVNRRFQNRDF
ncbi:MAG: hypothetical protein IT289_12345 [Oligoflexia bacterium]|nr:hypothetical protein [Oligoflexia bacterium]